MGRYNAESAEKSGLACAVSAGSIWYEIAISLSQNPRTTGKLIASPVESTLTT